MEKVNKNMYHIFSIKSEKQGRFLDVSRCSHANQRQGNVQESVLQLDLLYIYCFFFHSSDQGHPTFNLLHFTHRVRLFFVESKMES